MNVCKKYKLINAAGKQYESTVPGNFGGHKKLKIYGRLDCPSALRYIAQGQYVEHRVFFADANTAIKAGYRPCSVCMKEAYKKWKMVNDLIFMCKKENLNKKGGYHESRYIELINKIAECMCNREFHYGNYIELSGDAIDSNCNNASTLDLNTCIATLICVHRQQHFNDYSDLIIPRLESGVLLRIAERIKELVL